MPIPDFTDLTDAEILAAIGQLNDLYAARVTEAAAIDQQRREQAGETVAVLAALLGPDDSAPYDPATGANMTINGVLAHDTEDHAVLSQYAGMAISLILQALRVDVKAGMNLGEIIANAS